MLFLVLLQLQIIQKPLPIKRPEIRDSSLNHIVIHNDGANLDVNGVYATLKKRRLQYHYFIDRQGTIYNFVPVHIKANHAGFSRWGNLSGWNDFSIGICLQGKNTITYSEKQYETLKQLLDKLFMRYPDLLLKKIVGHGDVAYPRGRKRDPGELFEWEKIQPNIVDKINKS